MPSRSNEIPREQVGFRSEMTAKGGECALQKQVALQTREAGKVAREVFHHR